MARAGTEAIVEALDAVAAQVYLFNPESAQLERAVCTGELPDAAKDRDTISPSEHFAWQAFSQHEAESGDSDVDPQIAKEDCDEFTRAVIPLSAHGVLVIYLLTDGESDSTFIHTAARNLTAALDRTADEDRLQQLTDRLREQNDRLERKASIAEDFRQAHERLITASSPDMVFDILVEFGASQGTNAWVGEWDARQKRLTPITEAVDGGPATEHGDTVADAPDSSPLLTAVRQGTPTAISDVRKQTDYEAWSQRLLRFGYQSSVALPISRNGLPHAALEIVSADTGGIPDDVVDYAVTLCHCAGLLLEWLSQRASSSMVTIDIDFPEEQFFFERADTEMRIDSEEAHFVGDKLFLDGEAEATDEDALRSYLADQPSVADIDVTPKDETYLFGIKIVDGPTTPVVNLKQQLDRCNATLRAVSADAESETVTVQLPSQSVTDLLEGLEDSVGTCMLRTKRPTDQAAESASRRGLLDELTERQVEIISAAYQLGYYEQPKSATGEELAEQFDLSASTVHQHLRSGARKIISQLFGTSNR
jgi:DNA-binding NarL/FixJ family response regulator